MAKVVGTIRNEFRFLGIKLFDFTKQYKVLSTEEMEDLANYILTRDASGYSEFGRLLNDPAQFTRAAFWMLKGPEILNEMQKQIKEAYLRGYNETHKPANKTNKVFTKPTSTPQNKNNNQESQYAYFDEDSYLNN